MSTCASSFSVLRSVLDFVSGSVLASVSTSALASTMPSVWPGLLASASTSISQSVSNSALDSTSPRCCQVSRPPCMVVYQVAPLPTHRPVRQEGFWPPLLLACQTMCRPVSRPPHHPGCREVTPLFPLLACQPPF